VGALSSLPDSRCIPPPGEGYGEILRRNDAILDELHDRYPGTDDAVIVVRYAWTETPHPDLTTPLGRDSASRGRHWLSLKGDPTTMSRPTSTSR
jgi:hypothetical protein